MIKFKLKNLILKKEYNENRRISLPEISKITGISTTTLSRIANKKEYITNSNIIEKLCTYFKCDFNDLMEIC